METKEMIKNINVENCIFRSNHASNYISLKGTLSKDKDLILSQIEEGLQIVNLEEKEFFRRL